MSFPFAAACLLLGALDLAAASSTKVTPRSTQGLPQALAAPAATRPQQPARKLQLPGSSHLAGRKSGKGTLLR